MSCTSCLRARPSDLRQVKSARRSPRGRDFNRSIPFELYSLIELVEPGLFPTFHAYDSRRGFLPQLNALMKDLKGSNALANEQHASAVKANAQGTPRLFSRGAASPC